MSVYFTIGMRLMCWKSSVYAGSSFNLPFDAVNGGKEASASYWLRYLFPSPVSQGPVFEISGGPQECDLIAFQFEADILQRD